MSPALRETPQPSRKDWTEVAVGLQMFGLYLASAAFIQLPPAGVLADLLLVGVGLWVAWLGYSLRAWKVVAFGLTPPLLMGALMMAAAPLPENAPEPLILSAIQALLTMPLFALGFQALDSLRCSGGAPRPPALRQFPMAVLMWMTLTVACVFGLFRAGGSPGLAIGTLIGHAIFVGWLAARFRAAA